MLRTSVTVALVATLLVFLAGPSAGDDASAPAAPEFTLKDSTGKQHKLSDYKDKIVVLEWTEDGCPFVVRHVKQKTMKNLAKKYADKNVVWLAVNSSHFATAEKVEKWRKENEVPYPVLMDTSGTVGRQYKAQVTPQLFIIKDGKVVYSGAIDDDRADSKKQKVNYVDKALEELVAGKPVSTPTTTPYG